MDVLKIALSRRDELQREIEKLDDFIRMAKKLIDTDRSARAVPRVDPMQARFNSGEVLPPEPDGGDAERANLFRRGSMNVA